MMPVSGHLTCRQRLTTLQGLDVNVDIVVSGEAPHDEEFDISDIVQEEPK
jgi:hypothetical protein